MNPLVPSTESETHHRDPAEIINQRRVRGLDHAGTHTVAETCRTFGISRQSYYRWAGRAASYGLSALMPKGRRDGVQPNAWPPHVIEAVLADAVARPTLGARRLLEHLEERKMMLSASGVQKILNRHHLGRRSQRVAALAQITAAETGLVTDDARSGPFGFCHFAARPEQRSPDPANSRQYQHGGGRSSCRHQRPYTRTGPPEAALDDHVIERALRSDRVAATTRDEARRR